MKRFVDIWFMTGYGSRKTGESYNPNKFPLLRRLGACLFTVKQGLLLLILISTFTLNAQTLKVSANADTIMIGDIYTLELAVENYGESKVFFPEFQDTIGNDKIEIVASFPEDTLENKITKKWDLSIYYPGAFQVAGFSVLVQNKNGSLDTLKNFDPITIFVTTLDVDTSKAFKPLKELKSIPFPFKEVFKKYAPYALGIILAILLAIYLWYRYKNKDVPKYVKPKTALDYHREAIIGLKEIESQKLWQSGNIKEYYLGISTVLRTYLEGRFQQENALESTTDEIIADFKALGNNNALTEKLDEVLQECDLAKFAKFKPLGDENIRMMKLAKDFVAHTKPKQEIVSENIKMNSNG